jgi:hypothetical protein
VWSVVNVDRHGRHFQPTVRARVQPWWSVPATVGLLLLGAGISLWLLPQGRDLIGRFADRFARRLGATTGEAADPRPDAG